MNKEGILKSVGLIFLVAVMLAVISIPLWWATIHDIDQNLDNAVRIIPKEYFYIADAVEIHHMLVRQDIWFLFFFGLAGWFLLLWREIGRH